jgi:hypothetical protein
MLSRSEILTTVDTIATKRLFVDRTWLVDHETSIALSRTLEKLGLIEVLPDGVTMKYTNLGNELDVGLQQLFMGHWEPCEAPWVLEERQLLDESECEALFDLMETMETDEYEAKLRARVQQAYRDYHKVMRFH